MAKVLVRFSHDVIASKRSQATRILLQSHSQVLAEYTFRDLSLNHIQSLQNAWIDDSSLANDFLNCVPLSRACARILATDCEYPGGQVSQLNPCVP